MTRNAAIKLIGVITASVMGRFAWPQTVTYGEVSIPDYGEKPSMSLGLDDFSHVEITKGDESIKITAEEIWEALNEPQIAWDGNGTATVVDDGITHESRISRLEDRVQEIAPQLR